MSERHDPMAYNAEEHESASRCSLPVDHRDLSMAERIGAAQAHALLAIDAHLELLNGILAQMLEVMKGGK